MKTFQRVGKEFSSQWPRNTTAKKTAKSVVGNSMRGGGGRGRAHWNCIVGRGPNDEVDVQAMRQLRRRRGRTTRKEVVTGPNVTHGAAPHGDATIQRACRPVKRITAIPRLRASQMCAFPS